MVTRTAPMMRALTFLRTNSAGLERYSLTMVGDLLLYLSTSHSFLHPHLAPPELDHKPDDIEKTLNAIGVHYTHRNDDLIAPSAIEGQRMQVMLQVCNRIQPQLRLGSRKLQERKKKAKQAKERRDSGKKGKDKTPEPEWPPSTLR